MKAALALSRRAAIAAQAAAAPAVFLPAQPSALWNAANYSGSGNWLDETGNGSDLTVTTPARYDAALDCFRYINGDAGISRVVGSAFDFSGEFTVALVFSWGDGAPGNGPKLLSNGTAWWIDDQNGPLRGVLNGSATDQSNSRSSNSERLLAVVRRKADNTWECQFGNTSDSPAAAYATALTGGGTLTFGPAPFRLFGAAIFDRALSDSELTELATYFGVTQDIV